MRAALGVTVDPTRIDAVLVDADVPELGPFDSLGVAVDGEPEASAATAVEVMIARARRVGVSVLAAGITTTSRLDPTRVDLDRVADHARWAGPPGIIVLTCPAPDTDSTGHRLSGAGTATRVALLAAAGSEPAAVGSVALRRVLPVVLAVLVAAGLLVAVVWQGLVELGVGHDTGTGPSVAPPVAPAPAPVADCPGHRPVVDVPPGPILSDGRAVPVSDPGPPPDGTLTDPCRGRT